MTEPIGLPLRTIVILDTHPILRMGLATLLREKFDNTLVLEAKNAGEFQESGQETDPGLFILVVNSDFEEEGYNPVGLIKSLYPSAFIILYGEEMKPEMIIEYLKTGANGYLSKHHDLTELVACINIVVQGKRYVSAEQLDYLFEYLIENYKSSRKQDLLTPRQKEIANFLVQGLTTSSIANKTGLHLSTISTFKAAIFSKLGIDNILKLKQIMEADESYKS
jgi:DNA-binding NarL/FixJ family response regulator